MLKTIAIFIFFGLALLPAGQENKASPAEKAEKQEESKAAPEPAEGEKNPAEAKPNGLDPLNYVIGAEDVLIIRVWREPDLSGSHMVRPDGKISLPLINEVQAAGLTPLQLTKSIANGLAKFMNQPEVSVAVQTVNSKNYFLQGEVLKPGKYPLLVPTTVLQALVNAGGFQEFANRKKIVIMRGAERFKFNYNEVIGGKRLEQNILLQSGDLIIVP
jgi:polysaccharide export outer membrane protein